MQNMNIFGKFLVVLGLFQESQWCWMWDTLSIESDKIHKKEKCFFFKHILNRGPPYKLSFQRAWCSKLSRFFRHVFYQFEAFKLFPWCYFYETNLLHYASLLNAKEFFQKDHIWYVKPLLTSISIIIAAE